MSKDTTGKIAQQPTIQEKGLSEKLKKALRGLDNRRNRVLGEIHRANRMIAIMRAEVRQIDAQEAATLEAAKGGVRYDHYLYHPRVHRRLFPFRHRDDFTGEG